MGGFAFHPILQTLGVSLFGLGMYHRTKDAYSTCTNAQNLGILILQPTSMNRPKAKARGFGFHQLLILCCGVPSLLIGTLAIIRQKFVHESDHFTTWHGVRFSGSHII